MTMKTTMKIIMLVVAVIMAIPQVSGRVADDYITVEGRVIDKESKEKLSNVTITLPGSRIMTVSNNDGEFSIKIPTEYVNKGLRISKLGYASTLLSGAEIEKSGNDIKIGLSKRELQLSELLVLSIKPEEIVEHALGKIAINYSDMPTTSQAFYRESVQKGSRYVSITEGFFDVKKTSYKRRMISRDSVKVAKGRRIMNQKGTDTIAVKIMGGPAIAVMLDVVKNEDALLIPEELQYYKFTMEPGVSIDDRPQYVVSFEPKLLLDYAMYKGKMYIDRETEAISRAEYEMVIKDKNRVTNILLKKKPAKLRFNPERISTTVSYTYDNEDGRSYLHYINSQIKFKCDWKRRLFASSYVVDTEMVMVDRDETESLAEGSDAFKKNMVFDDIVDRFDDPTFWSQYTIIEPTEKIEKAVRKMLKHNR